jgi:fucose permease
MLVLSLDRYTEADNTYRFLMFIPCMMGAYHHTDAIDTSFASTMLICAIIVAYAREQADNTNTPS